MILTSINNTFEELIGLLNQLTDEQYSDPCFHLSNSSIGEHTRHIIELFQCLESQYDSGIINYDLRQRNLQLQTSTDYAIDQINVIQKKLSKENNDLVLVHKIDGCEIKTESNYYRELLYNFEHCIHHQALIKVAVLQNSTITIDESFGVARSTMEYRKQCAQ